MNREQEGGRKSANLIDGIKKHTKGEEKIGVECILLGQRS